MNYKILFSIIFSALFIGGLTSYIYAAEDNTRTFRGERFRHQMQMTEEERAAKLQEIESLSIEAWKQKEINRINSVSEDQFNKMKESRKAFLENNNEGIKEFKGGAKPLRLMEDSSF